MSSEELLLQRFAEPIGEDGVLRIEDGCVQKRHRGEGDVADVVAIISGGESLTGRALERFASVMPKSLGIGDALAAAAQAFDGGEDFLKNERQAFGPADCRRWGPGWGHSYCLVTASPLR